jgi:acetyl-CoA carboxylase carboxyltransferase component
VGWAIFIVRAVIRRMARFIVVAETALVLLAVLTDVSGFMAFMTGDARGFGGEVRSGDESGSKFGELFVPSHAVYGRGLRVNRYFYAR